MDVPEASQRFGLLLEAYLRGSVNHIPELRKQMDAMGKMRSISELLHSKAFRDRVSYNLFSSMCLSIINIFIYICFYPSINVCIHSFRTREIKQRKPCYNC